jgi:S-adenosylmethionine uptake transporter
VPYDGRTGIVAALAARTSGMTKNARGILAMLGAMGLFICGDAVMKIMGASIPSGEAVFLRGVVATITIWTIAIASGAITQIHQVWSPAMALRSLGDLIGITCFQIGLARLPFADVSAILQINPLMVTAAAAIFLGEKVGWRRWTATGVGFIGVLMIIRPGSSAFDPWSLILILASIGGTLRDLATRKIAAGTPLVLIIAVSTAIVTAFSPLTLFFESWIAVTFTQAFALGFSALCMVSGLYLVAYSVRTGEIAAVVPYRYSSIIWAIALSMLIWGQFPDRWTMAGITILICAGLYTFHREQVRQREARQASIDSDTQP